MVSDNHFWFNQYLIEKEKAEQAELALKGFASGRNLLRAKHVAKMGKKIRNLRRIIRHLQEKAETHNEIHYATGLIVNCTGCDAGEPFKPENLTEDYVKMVEQIATRLRTWWTNHNWRKRRDENKQG